LIGSLTALRLSETAALDLTDMQLPARKDLITVRACKGGRSRELPGGVWHLRPADDQRLTGGTVSRTLSS
jgi:hypothetical protein